MSLSWLAFIHGENVHSSSSAFEVVCHHPSRSPAIPSVTGTWRSPSAISDSSISKLLICAFLAHWVTSELQEKNMMYII